MNGRGGTLQMKGSLSPTQWTMASMAQSMESLSQLDTSLRLTLEPNL
jgi:hypothetical protein